MFILLLILRMLLAGEQTFNNRDHNILLSFIPFSRQDEMRYILADFKSNPDLYCEYKIDLLERGCVSIEIRRLCNPDLKTKDNILPKIFCEIDNLKILNLSYLKLSTLPEEFKNLTNLENLYLQANNFAELPKVLCTLKNLKELNLSHNKLDFIPHWIIKMQNLEKLYISYSLLKRISCNIFKMKKLKELDLTGNVSLFSKDNYKQAFDYSIYQDGQNVEKLSEESQNISIDMENNGTFKKLYLVCLHMSKFPEIMNRFRSLEFLNLKSNRFHEIPQEIHSFDKLKEIDISFNQIEKVFICNGMFKNLQILKLDENKINQFIIQDDALKTLEKLYLFYNRICKLDRNILGLENLNYLSIDDNNIEEIEKYTYTGNNLINLRIQVKDISVIPNIFVYNRICALFIRCKEPFQGEIDIFEHIPLDSKIEHLKLSDCYLYSIPYNIFKLPNLVSVNLYFNSIIKLDNYFGFNGSLKELDISCNMIYSIDGSIFDIITLERLNLRCNRIYFLPAQINNISNNIIKINLHDNPLRPNDLLDQTNNRLISIEQVNSDIIRNIQFDRERLSRITDLSVLNRLQNKNFDIKVKDFYAGLNIPNNERLNLKKIKECKEIKPDGYKNSKEELKNILKNVFEYVKPFKEKEKLEFLMRKLYEYFGILDDEDQKLLRPTVFAKVNSIVDYFESIFDMMNEIKESKKDFVDDIIVRLLNALNFKLDNTKDDVPCLDGQGEAFIEAYMKLKLGGDYAVVDQKMMHIIADLKEEIIKNITTGLGEKEELETFLAWKNILSEELGFQKVINLYGNSSKISKLHDKKYILEQFFDRFTLQSITDEINKHLKKSESGLRFYNQVSEYISITVPEKDVSNIFEYIQDDDDDDGYLKLKNEGGEFILNLLGYLDENMDISKMISKVNI
ncbi:Leucine rich repeat protein [Spraguea lophii 42_110]|uniref:Leucine rich repeat protein n=1 Tax=Spraguea lophii (strain 42_110) TaxID=1358809 RepID=S7WB08_SPRLO|nr:Leucine rich repeat protein [Spraguea lophii 42_110]